MEHTDLNIIRGGFRKRKMPLTADYRPLYKIGLILMILKIASNGKKASLNKLHFLIYALKSSNNRAFIRNAFETDNILEIVSWGVEPALNKALVFAEADKLIEMKDDRYSLTEKGEMFAKLIETDKELFREEKEFLLFIGKKKVTEGFITTLTNKIAG